MEVHELETFLEDKHGITLDLYDKGDYIILSRIMVENNERGLGKGTKAMRDIVEYADDMNLPIYLTPAQSMGTFKKLIRWYSKYGFEKNLDKSKTKEYLVRYPDSI